MSGVLHSVGKVFKKVVKVVKKVAPIALVVGAVVLTGGAALGALPAVGTVLGGLGLSAGVTAALTSAVTTAAIGAGVGAATSAITGKNIVKGATKGGLIGFAAGGIAGGVGALTAAAPTAGATSALAPASLLPEGGVGLTTGAADAAAMGAPALAAPAAAGAGTATAGSGILSTLGRAATPSVIGSVVNGIGQGISANEKAKGDLAAVQKNREMIAANYSTTGRGLINTAAQPVGATQIAPADKFDPYVYGGQFVRDENGNLKYVPRTEG